MYVSYIPLSSVELIYKGKNIIFLMDTENWNLIKTDIEKDKNF